MKWSFISLGLSTDAIGIRILSSLLKARGHDVQLIFLPSIEDLRRRAGGGELQYPQRVLDQISGLCRESGAVGLSVMTHHYAAATALTKHLKSHVSAPVVWGGVHPTVTPERCLHSADFVGVGEGETAVPDMADRMAAGRSLLDIPGMWTRDDTGRVVDNGAGPLTEDLDSLPFPDYSFDDHHLLVGDGVQPMTAQNWHAHLLRFFPPFNRIHPDKPAYQVLSARGCPYHCTFCGEVPVAEMYKGRYFRKRSIGNLIQELTWVKRTFDFIGEICFCDDTFPSRPLAEIRDFAEQYKQNIAMPFYCLVSPANVKREKFDLLVDAGLTTVGMGIQSGSPRVLSMYGRDKAGNLDDIRAAAQLLNSYRNLTPYYDFIVENPYEWKEDVLQTVRLMTRLPRPMRTRVYALSFFPGTPLHSTAVEDHLVAADAYEKTFGQRSQGGYLNFVIDLTKHGVPQWLLKVLVSGPLLFVFDRSWLNPLFLWVQQMAKRVLFRLHVTDSGLS